MTLLDRSRMCAFPDELLLKIFEHYVHPAVLMVLAAVCRRWKGVAFDESLWKHIFITQDTTLAQLRAQLKRSGSRPLDVQISFATSRFTVDLRELCQYALAEFWRLEHLAIETCRNDDDDDDDNDNDDDDNDDDDDPDPWPTELTVPLTSGNTWPHLQSLKLDESDSRLNAALSVDIDAPKLQMLALDGVSTSQWPSMRVGPALRVLEIRRLASASGVGNGLSSCANLRSLYFDCHAFHSNEPLHFDIPRSMAPFTNLVHLHVTWRTVDLLQILSFLRLCPRLKRLLLSVTEFTDHDNAVGTRFQLPSLAVLHLEALLTDSPGRNILRALLPALGTAALRDLNLRCVDMDSCESVLGPNLQNLRLTGVRGEAAKLFRAISQCHLLRILSLHRCELLSLHEPLEKYGQRLPALQDVSLALFDTGEGPGPTPDEQAANQCLVRLLLSLVDGPRIPSLQITFISLTPEDVVHVCQEIGAQLSLQIYRLWSDRASTRLVIGHRPSSDELQPLRTFEVDSLVEALRALSATVHIFARIASLSLDMRSAVEFFAALPSAAQMPLLGELTLELEEDTNDCDVPSVLATIAYLHCSIDCPSLRTVTLMNSWDDSELPPAMPRVSSELVDHFLGIFDSHLPVEFAIKGFIVLSEAAAA